MSEEQGNFVFYQFNFQLRQVTSSLLFFKNGLFNQLSSVQRISAFLLFKAPLCYSCFNATLVYVISTTVATNT